MLRFARLPIAALALFAASHAPALAQSSNVYDVGFFERVAVGPVELTPFGVVRDQRCADARFCFRPNDMRVSVILHDQRVPYEVVLVLGEAVEVPGGYLVLLDPGTRPRQRGALRLSEYALDIAFVPDPDQNSRQAGRSTLPRP